MLSCQKDKFSIPNEITYLNCAYMSPLSRQVTAAGIDGVQRKTSPWNVAPIDFFEGTEKLKATFAKVINAPNPQRIALIPAVSYATANIAKNIKINGKKEIILVAEQFPSNYYCWERLAQEQNLIITIINAPKQTANRGKAWNEAILNAINKDTLLVTIANVHWADGTRFDLKAIRQRSREVEALLVVDGSQSIGALPLDIQEVQLDALITVGYKWLMGPYSLGYAYYGEYFDGGIPVEESWLNRKDSDNFANLVNYESEYLPAANRYMVGQHSNFITVPMAQAALEQILDWGIENIQNYCASLTQPILGKLQAQGFVIEDVPYTAQHLLGLRLPENNSIDKLKSILKDNNIYLSQRGNALRISPNVYNDLADMEKLWSTIMTAT